MRCKQVKPDGDRCRVDWGLNPVTGLCYNHDPEKEEERNLARSHGGKMAARHLLQNKGLDTEALGALKTVRDAQRWLKLIAEGVVTNRLKPMEGNTGVKALEAWLKAEHDRVAADDLADLRTQLQEVRDGLKRGRPLEVVK